MAQTKWPTNKDRLACGLLLKQQNEGCPQLNHHKLGSTIFCYNIKRQRNTHQESQDSGRCTAELWNENIAKGITAFLCTSIECLNSIKNICLNISGIIIQSCQYLKKTTFKTDFCTANWSPKETKMFQWSKSLNRRHYSAWLGLNEGNREEVPCLDKARQCSVLCLINIEHWKRIKGLPKNRLSERKNICSGRREEGTCTLERRSRSRSPARRPPPGQETSQASCRTCHVYLEVDWMATKVGDLMHQWSWWCRRLQHLSGSWVFLMAVASIVHSVRRSTCSSHLLKHTLLQISFRGSDFKS